MRKKPFQTINAGLLSKRRHNGADRQRLLDYHEGGSALCRLAWVKGHSIWGGQCPVMKYHRELMEAILHHRIHPGQHLNVTIIALEQAAEPHTEVDNGPTKKFVFNPHSMAKSLNKAA